jgi:hypothetical protein
VLVRLSAREGAYLDAMVPSQRERAGFLRELLVKEQARRERRNLAEMFRVAASTVSDEDRAERRTLIGAFSNRD